MQIFIFTVFALIAFAANSLLARLALRGANIDAASFSTIRLISGTIMLLFISLIPNTKKQIKLEGSWISAVMLFFYVAAFSFAYLSLTTGTGALILFGSVQITMIIIALIKGERPQLHQWIGLLIALIGLIYLISPGLASPPLIGAILMTIAGISWGVYSFRGKSIKEPLSETAGNFLRSLLFVIVIFLISLKSVHISKQGLLYAIISGSITSGLGYVIWYTALKKLTTTYAATVQLIVPILTAIGGIIILSETLTLRLLLSAILILSGISISIPNKRL